MVRRIAAAAALVLAALAGACDSSDPSAPEVDVANVKPTPAPAFACAFSGNPSLSNAATGYFTTNADRDAARDLIAAMEAAFATGAHAGARDRGFDLLSLTGKVSRQGSGTSPLAGEALVEQAIQCMFNVDAATGEDEDFEGWPEDNQFDFEAALTVATGGVLYVRGGLNTNPAAGVVDSVTYPVIARHAAEGNLAVIAPPPPIFPEPQLNWRNTASPPGPRNGILDNRVLIYGEQLFDGLDPVGYDFKLIPRTTAFTPRGIIVLCPAATVTDTDDETKDMIEQEGVGVLGFVPTTFCGMNPSLGLLDDAPGAYAFLRRLGQSARELLTPAPLQAAAVGNTPIGGSTSGAKGDQFTVRNVPNVALRFNQPSPWPRNFDLSDDRFTITVQVALPNTGFSVPVGGIQVSLSATNNNGFTDIAQVINEVPGCTIDGVNIIEAPPLVTKPTVGANGEPDVTTVTWENACFTKSGAVKALATAQAVNRNGGAGSVLGPKLNVSP